MIWVSTNAQLMENADPKRSLVYSLIFSVPISLLAFYGTKIGYDSLGSAWSVRLAAFGLSYAVFPIMTYVFLGESPFEIKTMICIFLSITIICVQTLWPQ